MFNDRICYLKGSGKGKSQGNFRYLVLSYLRLEGIIDFEGNRPGNHQNSLKSRPGNNKGIKYHIYCVHSVFSYHTAYLLITQRTFLSHSVPSYQRSGGRVLLHILTFHSLVLCCYSLEAVILNRDS